MEDVRASIGQDDRVTDSAYTQRTRHHLNPTGARDMIRCQLELSLMMLRAIGNWDTASRRQTQASGSWWIEHAQVLHPCEVEHRVVCSFVTAALANSKLGQRQRPTEPFDIYTAHHDDSIDAQTTDRALKTAENLHLQLNDVGLLLG